MHRIDRRFAELARDEKKALCVYLCVGDPSLDASVELALEALSAGADLLELGVPFSDPTADGPILGRAAQRAIAAGATLERVLEVAARIRRERADAPLVLFTYYNPIFVTGEERVAELAEGAGIDAILVVDLPPEEAGSLRALAARRGVGLVPLVSPTSRPARIEVIRRESEPLEGAPRGFVYAISRTGVTGEAPPALAAGNLEAGALRRAFGRPVLVGFGIDSGESARRVIDAFPGGIDGVVVGTAIVKRIERARSTAEAAEGVRDLVAELRSALD
jgi:tryptophan synthase alpha chain